MSASAPSSSARLFRSLPSMDALLARLGKEHPTLAAQTPRPVLRELATAFLDQLRASITSGAFSDTGSGVGDLTLPSLMPRLAAYIADKARPHFRRVLNATGVVIHTNLGRSLLAEEAVVAVREAAAHYSNLEFDLETGERGSRYSHVEALICKLTGAEAALVVNNNAAAVLLVLDSLCKGCEVIVSRGQLVEIGGSFRIPEVMEKSGCVLREVGATNRTYLHDYESAITENTAALMKVHTSNYRIIGFTNDVAPEDLSRLAGERGIPCIEDLGSGSLCNFSAAGLPLLADEPTVQAAIAAGVDVVTFSGDKVLGGPQAGIIAGRAEYVNRIKKNPLNRALRIDKLTLAALEATLRLYAEPEIAMRQIPTLRMINAQPQELKTRAQKLTRKINAAFAGFAPTAPQSSITAPDFTVRQNAATKNHTAATAGAPHTSAAGTSAPPPPLHASVCPGVSRVGGGAFPERDLPTFLVRIRVAGTPPDALRHRLLHTQPPLVARVEQDSLCLDVRTLRDDEFSLVVAALEQCL